MERTENGEVDCETIKRVDGAEITSPKLLPFVEIRAEKFNLLSQLENLRTRIELGRLDEA